MNFTYKVKMNNANQIIKAHGLDDNGTVTKFLRNTVDRFCDPYIPFRTGPLKNNKQYPVNPYHFPALLYKPANMYLKN